MDTNKMRDPVREQFEAWLRKEYQLESGDQINFANGEVRMMLKGWIASREAVVVELPKQYGIGGMASDYRDQGIEECRDAIRAQGLRVAP